MEKSRLFVMLRGKPVGPRNPKRPWRLADLEFADAAERAKMSQYLWEKEVPCFGVEMFFSAMNSPESEGAMFTALWMCLNFRQRHLYAEWLGVHEDDD